VLESVGLTVNRLIRLAYGPFQLGTLPSGAVEEVGPRVIRELLGQHIRPENLPEGNTVVQTPPPVPGRRGGMPVVTGKSGSAISDPSRKPSRVRAAENTPRPSRRANAPRPPSLTTATGPSVPSAPSPRAPTSSSTSRAAPAAPASPAARPASRAANPPSGPSRPSARNRAASRVDARRAAAASAASPAGRVPRVVEAGAVPAAALAKPSESGS
jgi:23S rRNA pseudouridine2605 synthase